MKLKAPDCTPGEWVWVGGDTPRLMLGARCHPMFSMSPEDAALIAQAKKLAERLAEWVESSYRDCRWCGLDERCFSCQADLKVLLAAGYKVEQD